MRFFISIHLLLLLYIVAALVFWEIKLQKQSTQIYAKDISLLRNEIDSARNPTIYNAKFIALYHKHTMDMRQFSEEGATFFMVILIGAVVVYTSIHRRVRLSRQQNNFMLSVTHELKSPIAAMKLNLQTLEKHQLNEEKKKMLLDRCISESDRLNNLCNNMLLASQLEGRQYKATKETFDLSEMIEDIIREFASRYYRKFEQDISPGCKVTGDKVMLQMAVNNLLENAVKYTPENTPVTTTLACKDGIILLQVADQGIGISDAEKKKIFNKFYRIGNEESRKSKGTGLGLYLTNKIVLQHHGKICVKDNHTTGSVFEITLPTKG